MNAKKRKRVEVTGWWVGTVAELLGLCAAEDAILDMHIELQFEHTINETDRRPPYRETPIHGLRCQA